MIQLVNDTFVDADDIKEINVIKELSSVKITYEVRQLCEKRLFVMITVRLRLSNNFLLEKHYFLEEK